eukprot:snap_masked-scaffold_23-processed-gene-5.45-mRNA-1 protein AED:0.06 eAED:0.10 QI:0/-1/0/1/-1/1/1/0/175
MESIKTGWNFLRVTALLYCTKNYLFDITQCMGPSMQPTLNSSGDIILVSKLPTTFHPGCVVLSMSLDDPSKIICKRIIGTEGQRIIPNNRRIAHMKMELKNDPVKLARVKKLTNYVRSNRAKITIPKGHVWLEGDNPNHSTDSRHYGAVPERLIIGKAIARIWPITQFEIIHHEL